MTAPDYVPPSLEDQPPTSLPIPPPRRWTATRPGDLQRGQPRGPGLGDPGPDLGYALSLVGRFRDKLRLAEGEHEEDVVAGAVAVAMRRASTFGRAPVIHDLELGFGVFGFLDEAPADLVAWRKTLFTGAGHDYWAQRRVSDSVPDTTLRMTPTEVRRRVGEWQQLLGVGT